MTKKELDTEVARIVYNEDKQPEEIVVERVLETINSFLSYIEQIAHITILEE